MYMYMYMHVYMYRYTYVYMAADIVASNQSRPKHR